MTDRLSREDFFHTLAPLDDEALRKALWTLYWRGTAQMQDRVLDTVDPVRAKVRRGRAQAPADAARTLERVTDFARLARVGAYMGRDRRVSPSRRTKWRTEFRALATDAVSALRGDAPDSAIRAVEIMVDLACEMGELDYFRSEDPVAAARFVVSDAVEAVWTVVRTRAGVAGLAALAAPQLARWERSSGWTRIGDGWVAEHERPLAEVLAPMLTNTDSWGTMAAEYLGALDLLAANPRRRGHGSPAGTRTSRLAEWHSMLLDHLIHSEYEPLLDRLVGHPGLAGPELTFLQARLAHLRGDDSTARRLVTTCRRRLPGHPDFREFARVLGATPEPSA